MTLSVIFDCDGVLVDTEPIANRVLAALLTEAGVPTTFDDCMREYRGRAMTSVLAAATEKLGAPLPFDVADRYYTDVKTIFRLELQPVPGVIDALERIELPTCVASSGPHHKMEVTLRHTGLWDRFEGRIFSASEVGIGKPAPDLFLHAARQAGCPRRRPSWPGRSPSGVLAARAAGMRALAFTRHTNADELAAAGGEPFEDMAELPGLLAADA